MKNIALATLLFVASLVSVATQDDITHQQAKSKNEIIVMYAESPGSGGG
ncbi:hypothetical protein M3Y14_01570 [Bacillus thuringiensis]|nr:hypothetical protein [Bacillus thuringiensis]UYX52885.1 hypothetical protein M3Y14_01570 [Bacillus thuringiensis]